MARKLSSCTLIRFSPDAREAGSEVGEIRSPVNVTEMEVGLTEHYQATGQGLQPEKRLLITYERDYHGERELEYEGKRWRVIRKREAGETNGVILTIQPWDGIAGEAGEV